MKSVFFGTPEFAVPTLAAMVEAGHRPRMVVTQPARPVGRGNKIRHPAVAVWARDHGIEVRQPEKVRQADFMDELRRLGPDLAVVVAFGQIFRRELLDLPLHGCLNLHGSLLPRYRGAAPIQAAIAAGERRTGVTTMKMDAGMDTGPILLTAELDIGPRETAAELAPRLAALGSALMVETLARLASGTLRPRPQDHELATYAPRLAKADGVVDWRLEAREIYNRWRAFTPWPGLSSDLRGETVKILEVEELTGLEPAAGPGIVLGLAGGRLAVGCGDGTILGLGRIQRPGRRGVSAADFYHGLRLAPGDRFHSSASA